jgi:hypothetical protein
MRGSKVAEQAGFFIFAAFFVSKESPFGAICLGWASHGTAQSEDERRYFTRSQAGYWTELVKVLPKIGRGILGERQS